MPASAPPSSPARWRWERLAWWASQRLTRREADLVLRVAGAARLAGDRARLLAIGLPPDTIQDTLERVRSLADWEPAWTWAAQRFLGEARQATAAGQETVAALARRNAALAYHAATWLTLDDAKSRRALRSAATSLFAQAMPVLTPHLHRVDIPWRAARLPALFAAPAAGDDPAPLVVLLNGTTTAKEETILWSGAFLRAGLAVLALDWPGTGEAALATTPTVDCDDVLDGLRDRLRHPVAAMVAEPVGGRVGEPVSKRSGEATPPCDVDRLALVGISLGAVVAVRTAALDRRVKAAIAVTPPYDPGRWLPFANDLFRAHLASGAGGDAALAALLPACALGPFAERLRCPLLVFGAGRDLLVPPDEAIRLCRAAGPHASLVWYPDGGHALYGHLPDWTATAAEWLAEILSAAPDSGP